jgi:DNA adenine methylase
LRWQGGKRLLAKTILDLLATHHAYIETCCGGAAVFWAKPREISTCEILNDGDGDLVNFYWMLHKRGRGLAREVDCMPYSRVWFAQMMASKPRSTFGRAARFWYLNRVGFGARRRGATYGVQATRPAAVLPAKMLDDLDATVERLRGVMFESVDVCRLLDLYDKPLTLFYVDPPYWGTAQGYVCQFGDADHERLAAALGRIRGRWLLSYNDCPRVRQLYAGRSMRQVSTRYTAGCNSSTGGVSHASELLIANYELT